MVARADAGSAAATGDLAHVSNSFQFPVRAALAQAAPLFGPEGERPWAGDDWDPQFLYPRPARDTPGAVFVIRRSEQATLWVNTVFDLQAGRMQYVSFLAGVMVTVIDVALTPVHAGLTLVDVTYVRTALAAEASAHVRWLGDRDRNNGPEWRDAIEKFLHPETSL